MKRKSLDRKKLAWRIILVIGFITELIMIAVSVVSLAHDSYEFSYGQTIAYVAIAIWIYIAYLKQRHADVTKFVVDEKIKTHAIIDNLKEAVLVVDDVNNVLLYNAKAATLLGIQDVEWIGKDLSGLVDDVLRQALGSEQEGEADGTILSSGMRVRFQIISLGGSGESVFRMIFARKAESQVAAVAAPVSACPNAGRVAELIASMQSELVRAAGEKGVAAARLAELSRLIARADVQRVDLAGQSAKEKIAENCLVVSLVRNVFTVGELLSSAIKDLSGTARLGGVTVELPSGTSSALKISGDAGLLTLAVKQVLGNAVLESVPGGKIVIRIGEMGANVGIAVLDSGTSVVAESISDLYAPAYKGALAKDNKTARGDGAGYHLARGIVEAHGGTLTAESPGDGGLRVVIMLPGEA